MRIKKLWGRTVGEVTDDAQSLPTGETSDVGHHPGHLYVLDNERGSKDAIDLVHLRATESDAGTLAHALLRESEQREVVPEGEADRDRGRHGNVVGVDRDRLRPPAPDLALHKGAWQMESNHRLSKTVKATILRRGKGMACRVAKQVRHRLVPAWTKR